MLVVRFRERGLHRLLSKLAAHPLPAPLPALSPSPLSVLRECEPCPFWLTRLWEPARIPNDSISPTGENRLPNQRE